MLTIALPNGSLRKNTEELFKVAGIDLKTRYPRQHWVGVWHSLVFKVVWLKARDIPEAISEGIVHAGITGNDMYQEWYYQNRGRKSLMFVKGLCYGKSTTGSSRTALVKKIDDSTQTGPKVGETVVTEFPAWTKQLLPKVKIKAVTGSVEAYVGHSCRFGVTVVETGGSLAENGLKVVQTLAVSRPALYANPRLSPIHLDKARQLGSLLQEAGP